MKNIAFALTVFLSAAGTAVAEPVPCFESKAVLLPWSASNIGAFLKYATASRPSGAGGFDLCANAGAFDDSADRYREVVRSQNGTFSTGMTLQALTAGETAFIARATVAGVDGAQVRIIAEPSATAGYVVLRSEVRESAGGVTVLDGPVYEVPLPVTLAISRDLNGIKTWYLGPTSYTWQSFTSLNAGDELATPTLYVGVAIAAPEGVRANASWSPAGFLP